MHGHQRAAERFGVSRQTLWRFLDRDQDDRRLPRAVVDSVVESVKTQAAARHALVAKSLSSNGEGSMSDQYRQVADSLQRLATFGELLRQAVAASQREPVRTREGQASTGITGVVDAGEARDWSVVGALTCVGRFPSTPTFADQPPIMPWMLCLRGMDAEANASSGSRFRSWRLLVCTTLCIGIRCS